MKPIAVLALSVGPFALVNAIYYAIKIRQYPGR